MKIKAITSSYWDEENEVEIEVDPRQLKVGEMVWPSIHILRGSYVEALWRIASNVILKIGIDIPEYNSSIASVQQAIREEECKILEIIEI